MKARAQIKEESRESRQGLVRDWKEGERKPSLSPGRMVVPLTEAGVQRRSWFGEDGEFDFKAALGMTCLWAFATSVSGAPERDQGQR